MSVANVYGPIVTRRHVATALRDHLIGADMAGGWFLRYLREVQRIEGWAAIEADPADWPPTFQAVRFTTSETTVLSLPENDLPALLIGSPGLLDVPNVHGEEGALEGDWVFGLHALVSSEDEQGTDRLVGEYAAALMALCAQQRQIGDDFAEIVGVSDMAFDPIPQYASRTLAAGTVTVRVVVEDMVHRAGGPTALPEDPDAAPDTWPLFDRDQSGVTVDKIEED